MNRRWAASIAKTHATALGALRSSRDVDVCDLESVVWLRGSYSEELDLRLRAIPGLQRFEVADNGDLIPAGRLVPCAVLPSGHWTPIRQWHVCELPPTRWPGRTVDRATVRLVRTTTVEEPNLLLADWEVWSCYAASAPQVRLDRLSFAVNDAARVLIRGTPSPPIPGRPHVEQQGVAVPAGSHWEPAVDAEVLRETLSRSMASDEGARSIGAKDLFLFAPDGSWQVVPEDCFVQATRSAVRMTTEALHAGL